MPLFQLAGQLFGTVVTGSAVGEELIRMLVGGIALVLAVPVTTAVAAVAAAAPGVLLRPDSTRQLTVEGSPAYRFTGDVTAGRPTGVPPSDGADDGVGCV